MVNFNLIAKSMRVPGAYAEFDNTRAVQGLVRQVYKVLLIGKKTPAGKAAEHKPLRVGTQEQAAQLFGNGSQLWQMVKAYRDNDEMTELTAVAIDTANVIKSLKTVAATGSITLSGLVDEDGRLEFIVINEQQSHVFTLPVVEAQTIPKILEAFAQLDLNNPIVDVDVDVNNAMINLTAKQPGANGNFIIIEIDSPALPKELKAQLNPMQGGADISHSRLIEISIEGKIIANGTIHLYLSGEKIDTVVTSEQTLSEIAEQIANNINNHFELPFSATIHKNKIHLITKFDDLSSNEIDVRLNYYSDESLPDGLSININELTTSNLKNPDLKKTFSYLGSDWYNLIVVPYHDQYNLKIISEESVKRFDPHVTQDTVFFIGHRFDNASVADRNIVLNVPHVCIIDNANFPKSPWERASMVCAQVARSAQNDPALPFQTLRLNGDLPPAKNQINSIAENNRLLFRGISTFSVANNQVHILRLITTYTTNLQGSPDPSYLDINTMLILSYLRFSWTARVTQRFPRKKLANDGALGDNIVTPKTMKAEMIALGGDWFDAGLIENIESYKQNLQVVRPKDDVNRLDILLPPDIINQLRIIASKIQFRL